MVSMQSTALSLTKNQFSTHAWKNDSGTETSPGTVKQCGLYRHEVNRMGRFFQTIPFQSNFFPGSSLFDTLKGSPSLPHSPQTAAALSYFVEVSDGVGCLFK